MTETDVTEDILNGILLGKNWQLVLYNDDHNSFELVIMTLMEVLDFGIKKATETAMKVHTTGQATLKEGNLEELELDHDKLISRGLDARLEDN